MRVEMFPRRGGLGGGGAPAVVEEKEAWMPPMETVVVVVVPALAEAACRRQIAWPGSIAPGCVVKLAVQPTE
jgi:hypothetical protein